MQQNEGIGTHPAININFLTEPIDFENNRVGAMGDHRIVVVGKGDSLDPEEKNPYHIASILNAYIDHDAFPNWLFQLHQDNLDCFFYNLEQIQNSFIQETNGILFPKINKEKVIRLWNLERAFPLPAELTCKILLNLTHLEDTTRARLVCRQFNEEIIDGYYIRLRRYIDLIELLESMLWDFSEMSDTLIEIPLEEYKKLLRTQEPSPKELILVIKEIRTFLIDALSMRPGFTAYIRMINLMRQYPELEEIMEAANVVVIGTIFCENIKDSDMLDDHLDTYIRTSPFLETPWKIRKLQKLQTTQLKINQFLGKREGDYIYFHFSEAGRNLQFKLKCKLFGAKRWKGGKFSLFEEFIRDILVDKIDYCSKSGYSKKANIYNLMLLKHQKETNQRAP